MPSRSRRRAAVVLLALGLLGLLTGQGNAQPDGPVVAVLEVEGVIDGVVAGVISDLIAEANATDAELVALRLDSEGVVGVDLEDLLRPVLTSEVPVLVYVGDAGARAGGGAAYLAAAAHVLAVSPVTQLGAAGIADLAEPDAEVAPLAARLGELARLRGRDPEVWEGMAARDEAVVVLAAGATAADVDDEDVLRGATPVALPTARVLDGVADVSATSLSGALDELRDRTVTVTGPDGTTAERTLAFTTENANIRFSNLGLVDQVLHTVANPTLAYLFLIAGALCLAFEWFQPGFGVAGYAGVFLVALGAYGVASLPVRWLGVLALVAGLALLAVDLAAAGLGLVTAVGSTLVLVGSLTTFPGPAPIVLSPVLAVLMTLLVVVFFVVIMTTVLRAQGTQAAAHAEELVGKRGVVRSMLNPEGYVFLEGQLWRARAPEATGKVGTGTVVRVAALNDRGTLDVELAPDAEPAGRSAG